MTSYRHWIMMRNRAGSPAEQVYGEKFTEYDKAWYLAEWLNRWMYGTGYTYWLKESAE